MDPSGLDPPPPCPPWLCHSQRVLRLYLSLASSSMRGVRLHEVAFLRELLFSFRARQARVPILGLPFTGHVTWGLTLSGFTLLMREVGQQGLLTQGIWHRLVQGHVANSIHVSFLSSSFLSQKINLGENFLPVLILPRIALYAQPQVQGTHPKAPRVCL